jgi:hypothetical protein
MEGETIRKSNKREKNKKEPGENELRKELRPRIGNEQSSIHGRERADFQINAIRNLPG